MCPAPPDILTLVETFHRNRALYHRPEYNEAQTRREFIDPFFESLGWDVQNRAGYAPRFRDVTHEATVQVRGAARSPDYCFQAGGTPLFYVEAKKPSVSVESAIDPALQLRAYGWSGKVKLSILTDFEEFAVYDCTVRPRVGDRPGTARTMLLRYEQYADRWQEIAGTFSKQAVLRGDLDRYIETNTARRGTQDVDDAFLQEMEGWREALARNLALRNPSLTAHDLTFAVQMIIDRIVFLRICEDRGIEPYGVLRSAAEAPGVYAALVARFHRADDRYNSGLFHFRAEKGRGMADALTPGLAVDDAVLREVLASLYPPSPYRFQAMPPEILGSAYERFLGSVIRLTPGHQAKVEQKPEVRKAGGVYYTPRYIVDYIVEHTIGALCQGQTPEHIAGLRFLDPACGSGSFLLGAYQWLLDYHLAWYLAHRSRRIDALIYQKPGTGDWALTREEKKRILVNNLYGVDIDPQAVEVTKLSLCLKLLEGETEGTLGGQMALLQERALPDLDRNIQCGNSLIGPDYYAAQQMALLDDEERRRINVFDWQAGFPEIMKSGGFDAVIGNPPYVRIQAMKEWAPLEVEAYKRLYVAASRGNYDIYVVFVEKGLSLLNPRGRLGYILPHKFFNAQYGAPLRGLLAEGRHLAEVVHFGDQQVFDNATTYTCLMFLNKAGSAQANVQRVTDLEAWRQRRDAVAGNVLAEHITAGEWNLVVGTSAELLARLTIIGRPFGKCTAGIAQGIRTSANEVYVLDAVEGDEIAVTGFSAASQTRVSVERALLLPFLLGREVKRYRVTSSGKAVLVPYEMRAGQSRLIPENELRERYPLSHAYLLRHKSYLEQRERGRMHGAGWYGYVYPKNLEVMRSAKILVPDIASRASFAPDDRGKYAFTSGYGIIMSQDMRDASRYILGLLNSRLLDTYFKSVSTTIRGGYFRYFTQFIEQLPIRTIDWSSPADVARHDQLVALVEAMLALHRQLAAARTPNDATLLQRQIDATDREIDRLVYALYDLTEEEIALVEGA